MNGEATAPGRDWRPMYIQAAEDLRDRILGGEFPAGSAIPSEPVLAERYGISRTSIRNAIRQLRDWGLVETQQGSGTYILPRAKSGALIRVDRISSEAEDYLGGLDPKDPRSASRQIADQLRAAILSGRLRPDAKLPSQNQLSTRYGVARETVKAALRQLASEGLIVSRKGSGSFIRAHDGDAKDSRTDIPGQSAARAFKAAMDSIEEIHGRAVSAIRTMPEPQQAFDYSTELADKLSELAEAAAALRTQTALRIAEHQEGIEPQRAMMPESRKVT